MTLTLVFVFGLLLIGFWARVNLRILHWIHVPASIVAGSIGLLIVQAAVCVKSFQFESATLTWITDDLVKQLATWPSWLIAVVFAGMFLERKSRSLPDSLRLAGREGIMVWIIVLGQTALGLLATWLLIQPFYDVPNAFGMLIETGFAGGHGTAGAMGTVFQSEAVDFPEGLDLGIFMATVGLVFSVFSGVVYVNIAIRKGWLHTPVKKLEVSTGLEIDPQPPAVAHGTVRSNVIDPLLFQVIPLAMAVGIGLLSHFAVGKLGTAADAGFTVSENKISEALEDETTTEDDARATLTKRTSFSGMLNSFPLFIYTMLGGLLVRRVMEAWGIADLIDPASIQRFTGSAMDLLVVSAMTSLSLIAVANVFVPLLILLLVAFIWTGFCLLYLSRQLLPKDYWFELGIINYGMSTGTTATGMVLLKMVDRDLDSGAAENYALAAPLSSPFIGGGIITFSLPLLLLNRIPMAISSLSIAAIVIGLYVAGRYWASKEEA
ncbi:MAG TPA: sodium:glutamate symporter [Planctomycetaceae bacterium]|nr:sodium:glutamate symporter [Blastopirellula sp.]HAY80932.1 sodium:glutamate symporter [Planctomycetaceae bacterium]